MASIYDSYQLANSNATRQFQGSALPEMMKVSDIMQQRYDATEAYKEQLQLAQQSASPWVKDQPLYNERDKHYRDQLGSLTNRPDLENVTKDVARLGRQYAVEYKQFADNKARIMASQEELDKAVTDGKLSRENADEIMTMHLAQYSGLKRDNATGRYSNPFGNVTWAREVDVTEKIKKAVGDIVPDKVESVVEAKDGSGDYLVTTSSGTKWESGKEVQSKLMAAYRNDPEWQADVNQRVKLKSWRDLASLKPEERTESNIRAITDPYYNQVLRDMGIVADKYAFTEKSSGRTLDETAQGIEKAKNKPALFELSVSTPGSGLKVDSIGDVDAKIAEHDSSLKQGVENMAVWENEQKRLSDDGKLIKLPNGKVFVRKDGALTDITDAANDRRSAIKRAEIDKKKLETIKEEAAKVVGYDPNKTGEVGKEAERTYRNIKSALYGDVTNAYIRERVPDGKGGWRKATDAEIEQKAQAAKHKYLQDNKHRVPRYKEFTEELQRRLNPTAESSTVVTIGDEKTKKLWSENIQGLVSGLGLKNGSIGLKIGSGPNQGEDLTDEDYNEIKGDLDVVGFETDKNGQTVVKVRAYSNTKGKKTEGEDILVNLGGTTADGWLKDNLSPQGYHKFKVSGMIKGALSNETRSANMTLPGTDIPVKVEKEGNKWAVVLPGRDGKSRQLAETYEGVYDIMMQYLQQQ